MGRPTIVGLDLETSGTDHRQHKTIQVGVALNAMNVFTSLVSWPAPIPWDEESAKVHNIPMTAVSYSFGTLLPREVVDNSNDRVDQLLYAWLVDRVGDKRNLIACGFNVGSFDMPFFRRDLPRTASLFHYRTLDLNSLCFVLDEANLRMTDLTGKPGTRIGFDGWKRALKRHTEKLLGQANWHDAGYDALAAWLGYQWLADQVKGSARL